MIDIIYFELAAISLIDVALAIFIQRKITSVEKTYHLQNKMKKHMAELKELTDKKAPPEHLAAKQKEITQTMSDTMMHQFRATPVLLVLSVLLYFFVLPNLFPLPILSVSPNNPAALQTINITTQSPPGTNDIIGIWLTGGIYGSGNLISKNKAVDTFYGGLGAGNYTVEAYDVNTSVYSSAISMTINASGIKAASPTNSTTSPVYNLIVYKIKYHTFQQSLFFIIFTFVASLVTQLTLSNFDKKRFDAKYGVNGSKPSTTPTEEQPPQNQ